MLLAHVHHLAVCGKVEKERVSWREGGRDFDERRDTRNTRDTRETVSRNKDLMGCGMARDPEGSPVPPRERLLGLRLPHGSS